MADVALDPQNSNPKELFGQGVRAYVLQDYDTAVRAFSKASELLAAEHESDIHDSLGDVYLYYGKALLELSRKESGPLGEGVLKNVEEESEEDIEDSEGEGDKPEGANGDANKTDDEKTEEAQTAEEASKSEEAEKKEEDNPSGGTSEEKKEGTKIKLINLNLGILFEGEETEDELTDLQVAWEVLELAKRIFTNRGPEGKKNLAETLIVLGEISLESGNFSAAIEDMCQGLEIQKALFGNDSRTIAETFYKLGGAYSTNGQIDESIQSFNSSLQYLQNKVASLEKDEEQKDSNSEEIEELNGLMPEIQDKISDMKNLKTEVYTAVRDAVKC